MKKSEFGAPRLAERLSPLFGVVRLKLFRGGRLFYHNGVYFILARKKFRGWKEPGIAAFLLPNIDGIDAKALHLSFDPECCLYRLDFFPSSDYWIAKTFCREWANDYELYTEGKERRYEYHFTWKP